MKAKKNKYTTTREEGGFVFAAKGRAANDHTQRVWFCFAWKGETK